MTRRPPLLGAALACILLVAPAVSAAQSEKQVWSEISLTRIHSHELTFGVDIEPKVLVSPAKDDDPGWATLDVTPSVEYTHGSWLDVIGELLVARTKQTDDVSSSEVAPRIGLRLHFLSNLRGEFFNERKPKQRLVVRDLLRVEWRNLSYSDDRPDNSSVRVRNRFEVQFPLTRRRMSDDGVTYLLSDAELFWTKDDVDERFVSKERVRGGVGYRHNYQWRFEALYIWDRTRKALDDNLTTADHVLDIRIKRVW